MSSEDNSQWQSDLLSDFTEDKHKAITVQKAFHKILVKLTKERHQSTCEHFSGLLDNFTEEQHQSVLDSAVGLLDNFTEDQHQSALINPVGLLDNFTEDQHSPFHTAKPVQRVKPNVRSNNSSSSSFGSRS